jgi:hypothetical protein
MEGVLNGYVTNPNPTPTLTPNPNRNPNSNPNQINEKIQKETTLEIDQITKCQFGRWKLVKTYCNKTHFQIVWLINLLSSSTLHLRVKLSGLR